MSISETAKRINFCMAENDTNRHAVCNEDITQASGNGRVIYVSTRTNNSVKLEIRETL
ncbi:hypothetical protein D3C72_2192290 [compost metagenome]